MTAAVMPQQREPATPTSLEPGVAGGSALREYERRRDRHRAQVREQHPWIGRLILALNDDPAGVHVWAQGAAGERVVGAALERLNRGQEAAAAVVVLHDRRLRREDGRLSRANIDHLVVAPSGVWVVDAKTHRGALEVRRTGGLFSARVERLVIGGRDQTKLLDGLHRQVGAVRHVLAAEHGDVPVRGALCFHGTDLPWFGESIDGIPLLGVRGLSKRLRERGPLSAPEHRLAIGSVLAATFPAAT